MDIFLSRPTWAHESFSPGLKTLGTLLGNLGVVPRTLGVSDYPSKAPLDEVIELMEKCQGAIILGIPQIHVSAGLVKSSEITEQFELATEWNHLEAALAYSIGLPIVVIKHTTVCRGIFDRGVLNAFVHSVDMTAPAWSMEQSINGSLQQWKHNCTSRNGNRVVEKQAIPAIAGKPICPNCSTTTNKTCLSPVPAPFNELAGGDWECSKCKYVE